MMEWLLCPPCVDSFDIYMCAQRITMLDGFGDELTEEDLGGACDVII